jgi:hypothetical protein
MPECVEQRAEVLLKTYTPEELAKAAEAALRGDNRRLRRGAARLWCGNQSPLAEWKPAEPASLHRIVITVQQEARCAALRENALDNLRRWSGELTTEEIRQRLSIGLRDPQPSVRRRAILMVGLLRCSALATEVLDVLKGKHLEIVPLPKVPDDEVEEAPEKVHEFTAENTEAEVAALVLGYLQHEPAKPLLAAYANKSPSYAVALALMGEVERLKPEFFCETKGNRLLQFAAVEAVVRCRGRYGLDMALAYKYATQLWEEEYVTGNLKRMLLAENAPGRNLLENAKSLKDLKAWYDKYGKEYLKNAQADKGK